MKPKHPIRLSKSKFVAGVQCLKRLYFQIHQPQLAGETDEAQEARFDEGHEVGRLAQMAFPGGVLVDTKDLSVALERASELVAKRRCAHHFRSDLSVFRCISASRYS